MNQIMKKALEAVTNFRTDIETQIDKLEAERESLRRQRDFIMNQPRPRDEVASDIESMLEKVQTEFTSRYVYHIAGPGGMGKLLAPEYRPPTYTHVPSILGIGPLPEANTGNQQSVDNRTIDPLCLLGVLGDQIKPAIRNIIMTMEWPGEEGLAREDRTRKISEINKQIEKTSNQISDLLSQAEEVGISL